MGVNISNGNLYLELGSGSCVTCGGGVDQGVYPNPQNTKLSGPVLIYNTLGTEPTDLGAKWRLPWDATVDEYEAGFVTVIDADGAFREYEEGGGVWTADKEEAVLTEDGTYWYLTRFNGDVWRFVKSTGKLDKITSRTTHEITITRDGNGRVTTVTDGFGRETKFYYITYSSYTRLNEIREPAPGDVGWYSTFLQYDSSGRLVQITNPMGETTRFEYDGSSRISKALDSHGHATEYTYDGSYRVTNIQDPAANDTVIAYTSSTVRTVTNRLSTDTEYTIDGAGRVTKIKDALDNETEFTWDATTWEMLTMLGPKIPYTGTPWSRHKTIFTYNSGADQHELQARAVKKITNTDSTGTTLKTESWTYNPQHDVLTYVNELNKTTTYTYKLDGSSNSIGLVLTVVNPLSQTALTNTYDSSGNKFRLLTSASGGYSETTFAYNQNTANGYGTPDEITAPNQAVTNLKVDVRGRVYEETGPSGNTEKFEFDCLDRLVRQIHPDGTSLEWVYDCCHLAAEVDENKRGAQYEYDDMGRMSKTTDANGEVTTYGYNAEGWQTEMVNPRGKTTDTYYDDIGRVIQISYPGGWQENFTYWEPGMLKRKESTKGMDSSYIDYEYDDLYQLKKRNFTSGTDTELEWDAHGRQTKMKDASGEKRYYYDDADRLTKVEQGPTGFVINTNQNYILENAWNAASDRTQVKVTIRTQSAKTWDFGFLQDGTFETVTNPDSDVTKHEYLTDMRLKKITLKNQSSTKKSTREFFYQDTSDAHAYVASKNNHLRKTLDKKQAGTVIVSFEYELDPAGTRLSVKDKDAKYDAFGYDPKYQLKNETKWSAKVPGTREYQNAYVYDPNGNRLFAHVDGVQTAYTYGDNDEMTAAGSETFTYDHFGNTKTKVSGGNTTTFNWDFESHLTSIDYPGTSNDDTHEYDGNGIRMRSKLAGAANWTNFIHDDQSGNLLVEYTLISTTFAIKSENTWGIGLISTNREGTKRYFHYDGVGSTYALTDADEVITDTYEYNAFGQLVASANGSVNPYEFVGQWGYYDDGARASTANLCLLGIRYYDRVVGRFISRDFLATPNYYQYAWNSPIRFVDPTGLWPWDYCGFTIWSLPGCPMAETTGCILACWNLGLGFLACIKPPLTCVYTCVCSGGPGATLRIPVRPWTLPIPF